ncbi:MAG: fatty acid desaturase [Spirochaetae bacterium HGW-Spirochaetae-10]|nr:MAG: fatty acid desaturase [Spirochaetae bacterium HGW-Spirochaetae-10]
MSLREVNWSTALYIVISPFAAIAAFVYLYMTSGFTYQTLLLAFFMWWATGLSITAGYHRLFSHRSYEASKAVKWFFTFFGAAALEMSVIEWAYDHRNHHRYEDKDRDPYNIRRGFFFAHMGWLFRKRGTGDRELVDLNGVKDLWADPFIRFQHKYYMPFALFVSFVFPGLVALLWSDFWGGVLVAGLIRNVLVLQGTFCINSVCHTIGKQPYSDAHTSRDHWLSALLTFGEGYHNFHHEFPGDYRNGIRAFHFDPTKWLIWSLAKLGQAGELKRVPDEKILEAKVRMTEKRLAEKGTNLSEQAMIAARANFQSVVTRMKVLRASYEAARKKQEEEGSTIQEQIEQTREELLDAYRYHKSVSKTAIV